MHQKMWRLLCCLILFCVSCDSGGSAPLVVKDAAVDVITGQLGGACFPNQTCYGGLSCHEGVCVETGDASVGLDAGSCNTCPAGSSECLQDQMRLCVTDSRGCTSWTVPQPCPAERPFCSFGACQTDCADECAASGTRKCSGTGYQQCGQLDSDPCLEWGQVVSCGEEELCQAATGQCLASCGGQPCACEAGETKPCVDQGECQGGQRGCIEGEFGPCQWNTGPTPEACDGKDNDCDGAIDEPADLVAPPCSKQAGVCQGAVQVCAGSPGWQDCNDAAYAAHATSAGQIYEILEGSCDGQDNDCNGQTDEPTKCCQPDCAGKVCGADDGCGNTCTGGSCPAPQEVCQLGDCVCLPDCAGKVCGGPDGCGDTCKVGSCAAPNSVCNAGTCVCAYASCGAGCCNIGDYCDGGTCTPGVTAGWKVIPSNTNQDLRDVWGSAPDNIWAVGESGTILHWNGSSWSPDNSTTTIDLTAISGSAADDIWAMGWNLLLHYDGSSWSASPLPNTDDYLWDVWASAGQTFVAGHNGATSYSRDPVVSHFDGAWARWEHSSSNGYFTSVGGSSTSDVWALGWNALAHFDGNDWTTFSKPSSFGLVFFQGLFGVAPGNAWLVGSDNGDCVIIHYDGQSWSRVSCPLTSSLSRVHGTGAGDLWAVGVGGGIIHYDGKGWSQSGAGVTTEGLNSVWAASASEVWAVGDSGTILRYAP